MSNLLSLAGGKGVHFALEIDSGVGEACEISLSADLDDVFLHFLKRLENVPEPRSVAEARITPAELAFAKPARVQKTKISGDRRQTERATRAQ
jgi:hypothetical protein